MINANALPQFFSTKTPLKQKGQMLASFAGMMPQMSIPDGGMGGGGETPSGGGVSPGFTPGVGTGGAGGVNNSWNTLPGINTPMPDIPNTPTDIGLSSGTQWGDLLGSPTTGLNPDLLNLSIPSPVDTGSALAAPGVMGAPDVSWLDLVGAADGQGLGDVLESTTT